MVCKYFTTREKKIAIALMVAKLGLQDKLPRKQDEETVIVDDQPSFSPLALSGDPEVTMEDDTILGDIFHSPDCPLPPPTLATAIAGPQFTRTVLSMKGLVGMLKQCQTIQDRMGILDTGPGGRGGPSSVRNLLLHQPGADLICGGGGQLLHLDEGRGRDYHRANQHEH